MNFVYYSLYSLFIVLPKMEPTLTDVELASVATAQTPTNIQNLTVAPNRRWLFIAKTYASVAIQITIIFITCISCYHSSTFRNKSENQLTNFALIMFGVAMGCMILTLIANCAKKTYLALIPFLGFTVSIGLMLAPAILRYQANLLMHALVITAIATVACSVFVFYSQKNLHDWWPILFYLTCLIIIAIPVFFVFPPSKPIEILWTVIGIILFVGWLLVDTSDLIHTYNEDDWMIASMNITLDVLNLFVRILQLMGEVCDSDNHCCEGDCDGCDIDIDD